MLREGHLLIIPKKHFSCLAEYSAELLAEFQDVYSNVSDFLISHYGSVASFEHGIWGQSVYHSHVHLLPFGGSPEEIIPEGKFRKIERWHDLQESFKKEGGHLFFSIGSEKWLADQSLSAPRVLRDRLAIALGCPERGNWKEMHNVKELMDEVEKEAAKTKEAWDKGIW